MTKSNIPQSLVDFVTRMNLVSGTQPGHGMIRIGDRAFELPPRDEEERVALQQALGFEFEYTPRFVGVTFE